MLLVPQTGLRDGALAVLDPTTIDESDYVTAATLAGLKKFGVPIKPGAKLTVDYFVIASSVVNPTTGARCDRPAAPCPALHESGKI